MIFRHFSTSLIHFIISPHPVHFIFHGQFTPLHAQQVHKGFDQLVVNKNNLTIIPSASYLHYLHHKYFECNYEEVTIPLDEWFDTFYNGTKESHEKIFRKTKE